ncbi:MAG: glycosyltransferase family 4 protein [Chlorobi bacterium]|nr:glycosyltransferase family 4 protein [Chlorobiota bacterium]
MNIYFNGKDGKGWAIDTMRTDFENALVRLNIARTKNFIKADIIHNIWWNYFLTKTSFPLRFKKNIILSAVNFIDLENENYFLRKEFEKANSYATVWISPSEKQKQILEKYSENIFVLPYYIDFKLFNDENFEKYRILKKYNIPAALVDNKVIIGSFQRDSLGSDLSKPKWQKGPELLIDLLKDLPKDKFILLLSGPRRHFVIKECKKHNIPYVYIGKEMSEDDIQINSLPFHKMPDLYRITDLYLVTSKSEGGPKAVLEAVALKTNIFSTDVGLASDFLEPENIFTDTVKYKKAVFDFVENFKKNKQKRKINTEKQYKTCIDLCNYKTLDKKLEEVYNFVLDIKKR